MRLTDPAAFSTAARQVSIAVSSSRGGELGWAALDSLPVEVRSTIGALRPGQVSRPITLENAIGIYLLRDVQTVAPGTPDTLAIDYALFVVTGGSAEAQRVARQVDVCDDFYGIARGLPAERLVRETRQISAIPADLRAALAGLDEGEISTSVTRGGNATVLMLCQRQPATENAVDLEIAGNRILNVRLGTAAAHYLSQLRAETEVIDFATN
jgi:peptidyl-prolyl cis-trans isomerase SurA